MEKRRLTNLQEPSSQSDSITLNYFKEKVDDEMRKIEKTIIDRLRSFEGRLNETVREMNDILGNIRIADPDGYRERLKMLVDSRKHGSLPTR